MISWPDCVPWRSRSDEDAASRLFSTRPRGSEHSTNSPNSHPSPSSPKPSATPPPPSNATPPTRPPPTRNTSPRCEGAILSPHLRFNQCRRMKSRLVQEHATLARCRTLLPFLARVADISSLTSNPGRMRSARFVAGRTTSRSCDSRQREEPTHPSSNASTSMPILPSGNGRSPTPSNSDTSAISIGVPSTPQQTICSSLGRESTTEGRMPPI